MSNSRTIEVIAKSEDEARKLAEQQIGSNEKISGSEVLQAPARGLFGFVGKQEYKIKFTIEEKVEAQPVELVEHIAPKNVSEENEAEGEENEEMPVRRPRQHGREDRGYHRGFRHDDRRSGRDRRVRGERRERYKGRGRNRNYEYNNEEPAEEINIPERPKEPVTEEIKNNALYNEIFELIKEVAKNVGVEEIALNDFMRDGAWVIDTAGNNVSQLIGKRGKTLDSLQYLMNIIYNKGKDDRTKIVLDAQGYREKRYRSLISLANRMARKAVATGRNVELEPMSTLDRRTIHMALKDNEEIETFSKGVEPMRRVVIASKNGRKNNNNEWQPLVVEDNDGDEAMEQTTEATSVPMFMEDDA